MKEITIGVYHHDCWGSESSEKFPESIATEKGPVIISELGDGQKKVYCTMEVNFCDNKQRDGYLEYIKKHPVMGECNVIYKKDSKALISTTWEGSTSYGTVMGKNCTYTAPITQELGGYETHTVIAKNPNDLKKLLGELEILGEVKMLRVKNEVEQNNPYGLTEKQAKALRIARALGYYTWPRKVGLEEMAKASETSRRAFQENLRKAEAKVFPQTIRELGA
ncbi:MAG: helix-turn-helix domain-containing protein [archaeon]|nr:helix-turn-helix domain-containing protein [archaeon]